MKNFKKPNVMTFRQGYEETHQLGCQTAEQMTTDSQEFLEFGIDQNKIDSFKAKVDDFDERKFDTQYVLKQKIKTESKNKAKTNLLKVLYTIETEVNHSKVYESGQIQVVDLGAISNETDIVILDIAKSYLSLFENMPELEVSPELLTDLKEKKEVFDLAITARKVSVRERKIASQLRAYKATELYAEIRKYRELGKRIWMLKGDEARSQSYLMPRDKGKTETEEVDIGPDTQSTDDYLTTENPEYYS